MCVGSSDWTSSLCSVQLPHHIHDVELERISDYIVVSQPQGFTLAWQGLTGSVYIKMSPEFVGHTCGLCGNFNADTQDDLKTSYGKFYLICYRFPAFKKINKMYLAIYKNSQLFEQ